MPALLRLRMEKGDTGVLTALLVVVPIPTNKHVHF
jgi:hypothetical protein